MPGDRIDFDTIAFDVVDHDDPGAYAMHDEQGRFWLVPPAFVMRALNQGAARLLRSSEK